MKTPAPDDATRQSPSKPESSSDDGRLEQELAAYHEAGHAVVGYALKMGSLVEISIRPHENKGGVTVSQGPDPLELSLSGSFIQGTVAHERSIAHRVMILLAGEIAQRQFRPETVQPHHAIYDQRAVISLLKSLRYHSPAAREELHDCLVDDTEELLRHPVCAAAVDALAVALLKSETITGDEANAIIASTILGVTRPKSRLSCPHCERTDPEHGRLG